MADSLSPVTFWGMECSFRGCMIRLRTREVPAQSALQVNTAVNGAFRSSGV
jgi:hypothetical protein